MGVRGMWSTNTLALGLLIMLSLALSLAGSGLWIAGAAVADLAMMAFCFRRGMELGHGACGIRGTVERVERAGQQVYAHLDAKYLAQAWSPLTGLRGLLASALIPYATGGIYIILSLLRPGRPALELPTLFFRLAAYLLSCPWWPFIMRGHRDFITLTPALGAMLLITPFILPACTFAGYLQGPRLWQRSEAAMKQGRRRAKANARVGHQTVTKKQRPEI